MAMLSGRLPILGSAPAGGTASRFPRPVRAPQPVMEPAGNPMQRPRGGPVLGSFKKGGKVKKTGLYKLHKGENVAPTSKLLRAR